MTEIDSNNIYTQLGLNKPRETSTEASDELGQASFVSMPMAMSPIARASSCRRFPSMSTVM